MHYYEQLDDGTVIGLYDGSQPEGAITEAQYWAYHEQVARREHPLTRGYTFPESAGEQPLRALQHARVRTALISTYRFHPREHLSMGADYPKMWLPFPAKVDAPQRFSPPGTIGYYFGLSVDAAVDEASHYAGQDVESHPAHDHVILLYRTYFTDLLYLAPVLPMMWEHLDLPSMPIWQMYLAVMDTRTSNEYTDRIGRWARSAGYKGIIYPSARYRDTSAVAGSAEIFPMLNFVEIGSHLCKEGIAIMFTVRALIRGLASVLADKPPTIMYSEPNLVLFDDDQVSGTNRPVFYATYHANEVQLIRDRDDRRGSRQWMSYSYDEREVTLFVKSPTWMYHLTAPRVHSRR